MLVALLEESYIYMRVCQSPTPGLGNYLMDDDQKKEATASQLIRHSHEMYNINCCNVIDDNNS